MSHCPATMGHCDAKFAIIVMIITQALVGHHWHVARKEALVTVIREDREWIGPPVPFNLNFNVERRWST